MCWIARPGKFLSGKPFVKVNWASGLDDRGRPIQTPQPHGAADLAGHAGRDQLVLALVTARAPGLFYMSDVGELRDLYPPAGGRVPAGHAAFTGGGWHGRTPMPDAPAYAGAAARPDQYLDRGGGDGRRHRDRSGDRRAEVEVRDDRRHRQRHPDHGVGPAVHRRPRRVLPGARRAHRAARSGRRTSAARSSTGRSATRSTASSTSRRLPASISSRSRCATEVSRRDLLAGSTLEGHMDTAAASRVARLIRDQELFCEACYISGRWRHCDKASSSAGQCQIHTPPAGGTGQSTSPRLPRIPIPVDSPETIPPEPRRCSRSTLEVRD